MISIKWKLNIYFEYFHKYSKMYTDEKSWLFELYFYNHIILYHIVQIKCHITRLIM